MRRPQELIGQPKLSSVPVRDRVYRSTTRKTPGESCRPAIARAGTASVRANPCCAAARPGSWRGSRLFARKVKPQGEVDHTARVARLPAFGQAIFEHLVVRAVTP